MDTCYVARHAPAPFIRFGDDIEAGAITQMENACSLPVAVRGALMPDAHQGYGLPIGGVLAVDNAVIPYAVGMDIACRMRLSILDLPLSTLARKQRALELAIERECRFGVGSYFEKPRSHRVMDDPRWRATPLLGKLKDRAAAQLGTSGSGNHFVEFGVLSLDRPELGLPVGKYLAFLSHSGSRGPGGALAQHYSKLAAALRPQLPRHLVHLAWFDFESAEGQEYWLSMELMGRYAEASHALIHHHVLGRLGAAALTAVENHHNFAWREEHDGQPVIVHRKGATPAAQGSLGVIPGSMASPAYVVRGKGAPDSLLSAAHGAGRRMSRTAAKNRYSWPDLKRVLVERQVVLMSAGLDEVPMAYKDIETVMAAQAELVEIVARFDPRLVKMAPAGERPED